MPRGDGTGPSWGSGPGTGRGLGKCGSGIKKMEVSRKGPGRIEEYLELPAILISFVSTLWKLFKKPKTREGDENAKS